MNNFKVCEIFKSIQGESTRAGTVCSFIRLSGCNLRCIYCDTEYAFNEYHEMNGQAIIEQVASHKTSLVEITGGEPLLDCNVPSLCSLLMQLQYTVLVETNGSMDISVLPDNCIRIIDVKCPGSGMVNSFLEKNMQFLKKTDEIKYVLTDKNDFDWALNHLSTNKISNLCTVLFSPNLSKLSPQQCAEWIIDSNAPVRLGLQLHRLIWGEKRGV